MTAVYYGPNFPFLGGAQRVLSRQEDDQLIKNDLLQLLLTTPGERVHRPNFGTPLRTMVMEPLSPNLLSEIEDVIMTAIEKEEPRLTNVIVKVAADPDKHYLEVQVIAKLSYKPNIDFLFDWKVPTPLPS